MERACPQVSLCPPGQNWGSSNISTVCIGVLTKFQIPLISWGHVVRSSVGRCCGAIAALLFAPLSFGAKCCGRRSAATAV